MLLLGLRGGFSGHLARTPENVFTQRVSYRTVLCRFNGMVQHFLEYGTEYGTGPVPKLCALAFIVATPKYLFRKNLLVSSALPV